METNFDAMGKEALRQECRKAGISYSKQTNAGMRALLRAYYATPEQQLPEVEPEAEVVAVEVEPKVEPEVAQGACSMMSQLNGVAPAPVQSGTKVRDGKKVESQPSDKNVMDALRRTRLAKGLCPECGATSSSQTWEVEGVSAFCHECCNLYSAGTGKVITKGVVVQKTVAGYQIQKNRPEQNGIKRPSVGTVCGAVWDAFDADSSLCAKDLSALAEKNGWNKNNVLCEFYAWRKFNGIRGRQ